MPYDQISDKPFTTFSYTHNIFMTLPAIKIDGVCYSVLSFNGNTRKSRTTKLLGAASWSYHRLIAWHRFITELHIGIRDGSL